MYKYLFLYIYIFLVILSYIYDLLLGNQVNPVAYDKRHDFMTVLYLIGNIIWGLILSYSCYLGYTVLSLVLFLFYAIPLIIFIICDALFIELYGDPGEGTIPAPKKNG